MHVRIHYLFRNYRYFIFCLIFANALIDFFYFIIILSNFPFLEPNVNGRDRNETFYTLISYKIQDITLIERM